MSSWGPNFSRLGQICGSHAPPLPRKAGEMKEGVFLFFVYFAAKFFSSLFGCGFAALGYTR
jgi:hypothetical protein